MTITRSLPIPDFSKCLDVSQNNSSESNSPISPASALSNTLAGSLHIHSPTKAPSARVEKMIELIKSLGQRFHKLSDEEIVPIARVIDEKFSRSRTSDFVLECVHKQGKVTRKILLQLDLQIAYIFLKTKGGLKRVQGGFKTGTRVVGVKWYDNPDKIQVVKSFLLVSRDDKEYIDAPSFEEEVLLDMPELEEYVVLSNLLFNYPKIKKITGEIIPKSAGIYPFMQNDLKAHFRLPGIQHHHIAATMLGVAEALKYLHKAGISHGDVKKANILVDEAGRPKLSDLDLGNVYASNTRNVRRNGYGTLRYTAPEHLVCQDVMTLDLPALDVWAFGIILESSFCAEQFKELHDMKKAYKAREAQVSETAINDKMLEIHDLQMERVDAADTAARAIHDIMGDRAVTSEQRYKKFLETLGVIVLHPVVQFRPTFEKIVEVMKGNFRVVQ
ncbi:MAG: protein kinase [Chlamydiales bacterium]|nr:protein kinase [Chlamydiales bacterium]